MIWVIYPHHNANGRWRASVSNLRWKMTHWKRYRVTDAGPNRRHKLSLTVTASASTWPQHFNCHASFPASFATELHEEAYWKHLPALFSIREAVNGIPLNIEQGISTGEMPRACVELTRALLGQSAQTHSVNWNPRPYQTWRLWPLPDDWRRYYGNKVSELTRNALD